MKGGRSGENMRRGGGGRGGEGGGEGGMGEWAYLKEIRRKYNDEIWTN